MKRRVVPVLGPWDESTPLLWMVMNEASQELLDTAVDNLRLAVGLWMVSG